MSKIVLAVSSSISIYKALELVSLLKKDGHELRCILSENAKKLVSPALFHALSGYDDFSQHPMPHIELAKNSDLMIFLPTTANRLAQITSGRADDLIGSTFLCMKKNSIMYCAMNPTMWENQSTQDNVATLKKMGVIVEPPVTGIVACGDEGVGKLQDITIVKQQVDQLLNRNNSLKDKKILITSGGSIEYIDPVRIIGNLSSGKMGASLAEECLLRGAEVYYLHSDSAKLPRSIGPIHFERFETTQELTEKTQTLFLSVDALIMAAAPCDYKPKNIAESKIKSNQNSLTLELEKNPDILKSIKKKKGQLLIGFAAETDDLQKNALLKLKSKNLDIIVANVIEKKRKKKVGIGSEFTDFKIINDDEKILYETKVPISKNEASVVIIESIARRLLE